MESSALTYSKQCYSLESVRAKSKSVIAQKFNFNNINKELLHFHNTV